MTITEYKKELDKIKIKNKSNLKKLVKKYIKSNNPYKIGDIISDNYYTIKITKIKNKPVIPKNYKFDEYLDGRNFGCIYKGIRVKVDGTILEVAYKNKVEILQKNVIKRLM